MDGKFLVLGIIGASVLLVLVWNWVFPKVYRASALIEIGKQLTEEDIVGEIIIEDPAQLVNKVMNGAYSAELPESLGVDIEDLPEVGASAVHGIAIVELYAESSDSQLSSAAVQSLGEAIFEDHAEKLGAKREIFDQEIKRLQSKIKVLEGERKTLQSRIGALQGDYALNKDTASFLILSVAQENYWEVSRDIEEAYLRIEEARIARSDLGSDTKFVKDVTVEDVSLSSRIFLNLVVAFVLGSALGVFTVLARYWIRIGFN